MADALVSREPKQAPFLHAVKSYDRATLVALDRIDREDEKFQLRVRSEPRALVETLKSDGQQTPVVLWERKGSKRYKIVDGFQRVEAIAQLGGQAVLAVVRRDIDQTEAFALGFVLNARRRNLTPLDKAYAVSKALRVFEMPKPLVAEALGLSVRQVDRYLEALRFDTPIRKAMDCGRITLEHASILHRHRVSNAAHWVKIIVMESLSGNALRRRLLREGPARSRHSYLVRDNLGFRLQSIRFRQNMGKAEKDRIRRALEAALGMVG